LLDYVPWYSLGPAVGLVVNGCLLALCLAFALTYIQFKALRSLAVFYLSLFVYFLGYTFYGYQTSPQAITFWYGTMLAGLAWMPFTWSWFASDLRGGQRGFMFAYTLTAGIVTSAALLMVHHPAVLGQPLEFLTKGGVFRPQSWILRPLVYVHCLVANLLFMIAMRLRWWPGPNPPSFVRPMVWGIAFWLIGGIHDAFYSLGWPTLMDYTVLWLGSVWLSLSQALAVALYLRQIEDNMRQSEEKHRSILQSMEEGYYEMDLEGRIIFCNDAMCRITGYERPDLMGSDTRTLMQAADAAKLDHTLQRVLSTGDPSLATELELSGKNQEPRHVELSVSLIKDTGGQAQGFRGIARDVTQRKEADLKLVTYQRRLRSLAGELAQAEERERRRIAIDLHDGVGQYLAACKLRLSSMLEPRRRQDPETGQQVMKLLEQAIQDTRSLTARLSPRILHELGLEAALEWLAQNCRERFGLECSFEHDERKRILDDDLRTTLFRAASELLLNTAKHARARRAWINLRQEEDCLRLVVADDGVGFDYLEALERRSSGLGLFSLRERLEVVGGRLEVESPPSGGTRATLWVPLKDDHLSKGEPA
jgi:PAS domain S-box-containing protein